MIIDCCDVAKKAESIVKLSSITTAIKLSLLFPYKILALSMLVCVHLTRTIAQYPLVRFDAFLNS